MPDERFIVDNNVGRLAVWLRALGYDTLFINPIADNDLLAVAARDERIILTKDTGILQRRVVASGEIRAVMVEGTGWRSQLRFVIWQLGLKQTDMFTRCLECNALLESRSKQDAIPHVPEGVAMIRDVYNFCPGCKKYYWQGDHWQRMKKVIASLHQI